MPFITEEIFSKLLHEEESIMISKWPEYSQTDHFPEDEKHMEFLMSVVRAVRNIRSEYKVPYTKTSKAVFVSNDEKARKLFLESEALLRRLASVSCAEAPGDGYLPAENTLTAVLDRGKIYIPLGDLVDIAEETARLIKEKEKFEDELKRAQGKLSNESFVKKAPAELVEKEKEKEARYLRMIQEMSKRIENLK
jgi:valyl-tRNA synthetase